MPPLDSWHLTSGFAPEHGAMNVFVNQQLYQLQGHQNGGLHDVASHRLSICSSPGLHVGKVAAPPTWKELQSSTRTHATFMLDEVTFEAMVLAERNK